MQPRFSSVRVKQIARLLCRYFTLLTPVVIPIVLQKQSKLSSFFTRGSSSATSGERTSSAAAVASVASQPRTADRGLDGDPGRKRKSASYTVLAAAAIAPSPKKTRSVSDRITPTSVQDHIASGPCVEQTSIAFGLSRSHQQLASSSIKSDATTESGPKFDLGHGTATMDTATAAAGVHDGGDEFFPHDRYMVDAFAAHVEHYGQSHHHAA